MSLNFLIKNGGCILVGEVFFLRDDGSAAFFFETLYAISFQMMEYFLNVMSLAYLQFFEAGNEIALENRKLKLERRGVFLNVK